MTPYAVTFQHIRHRTRFEVLMRAPDDRAATSSGLLVLSERVGARFLWEWRHVSTILLPPETGEQIA